MSDTEKYKQVGGLKYKRVFGSKTVLQAVQAAYAGVV